MYSIIENKNSNNNNLIIDEYVDVVADNNNYTISAEQPQKHQPASQPTTASPTNRRSIGRMVLSDLLCSAAMHSLVVVNSRFYSIYFFATATDSKIKIFFLLAMLIIWGSVGVNELYFRVLQFLYFIGDDNVDGC